MTGTTAPFPPPARVVSVDVLRGLTILLMIFVNDVAGVSGTPAWLKHFAPADGDGMTIVDAVFPAFLFIVGLAIPLSLQAREHREETTGRIVLHVLTRSLSLLIIGVLMVNSDVISPHGIINPNVWTLLTYGGIFLFWVRWHVRDRRHERVQRLLRPAGALLLLAMAVTYRADNASGLIQLRSHWWGIVGLIGWAYLVAALLFILFRGRPWAVLACSAGLFAFHIAVEGGWLPGVERLAPTIEASSVLGSHPALVLLGAFMGLAFLPDYRLGTRGGNAASGIIYAAGLAMAGWMLYLPHETTPFLIINKNMGTPPWCLFSAAITAASLVVVHWLIAGRAVTSSSILPELAGKNALLAYILAPVVYTLFASAADLTGTENLLFRLWAPFAVGLARAIILSLLVTGIAAWCSRRRIVLKI
jgi:predicted acyltransferase